MRFIATVIPAALALHVHVLSKLTLSLDSWFLRAQDCSEIRLACSGEIRRPPIPPIVEDSPPGPVARQCRFRLEA
jgi:hypothetical protein